MTWVMQFNRDALKLPGHNIDLNAAAKKCKKMQMLHNIDRERVRDSCVREAVAVAVEVEVEEEKRVERIKGEPFFEPENASFPNFLRDYAEGKRAQSTHTHAHT